MKNILIALFIVTLIGCSSNKVKDDPCKRYTDKFSRLERLTGYSSNKTKEAEWNYIHCKKRELFGYYDDPTILQQKGK